MMENVWKLFIPAFLELHVMYWGMYTAYSLQAIVYSWNKNDVHLTVRHYRYKSRRATEQV